MPLLLLAALCCKKGQLPPRPACSCEAESPAHREFFPISPQTERQVVPELCLLRVKGRNQKEFGEWHFKASSSLSFLSKKRGLVIFLRHQLKDKVLFGETCYSDATRKLIVSSNRVNPSFVCVCIVLNCNEQDVFTLINMIKNVKKCYTLSVTQNMTSCINDGVLHSFTYFEL